MTYGRTPRAALGLVLGILLTTGPAAAGDLDFDLSDSAARFDFRFPVTESGLHGDVGILHHEDDGDMIFGGIQMVDDAGGGGEPFTVGLGVRAVSIDANVADGSAVSIGGFFRYVMPDYNRFAFGGYAYVAPSVTSFGDMDRYLEYGIRAEYRVMKKASLYLGARDVSADFTGGGDATIDDGFHVGISLEF
jgi:hypothetical protein